MKISTSNFIKSEDANRLPKTVTLDEQFAYILGLWKADRCSTAKGIVGLRNKDEILLEEFRKFFNKLGLQSKERSVLGYGKTKEVYVCSMPLRRIFEWVAEKRIELLGKDKKLILAYLAGVIDGDGTFISDKRKIIIRIFYGKNELADVKRDKVLLSCLGIASRITFPKNRKMLILSVRDQQFLLSVSKFLRLKRKADKVKAA